MDLQDYKCVLCSNAVQESLMHLMFICPFAQTCWAWLNCHISPQADLFQNIESFRVQLQVPFFMEIIILMGW
jgi:hypothetical protein